MNEIANTSTQTPIEIALGIDENGMTTARALYNFLEMNPAHFARWSRQNIEQNEFYEENTDWWGFTIVVNGNECKDYRLTTDFAKHLSMESHSAKGKIARQYFVRVEDGMKEVALRLRNMSPELQAIIMHDKKIQCVEAKVESVEQDLKDFKMDLPISGIEIDKITDAVKKKGVERLGGKESNAYKDKSLRGKVYHDIYRELKRQFGVSTYKAIKRNQCDIAIEAIQKYTLPYVLNEQVKDRNAQINLEMGDEQ